MLLTIFYCMCFADCPSLLYEHPMSVNTTSVWYGTGVQFFCDEAYELVGEETTYCDLQGTWNPPDFPYCRCKLRFNVQENVPHYY